jgi:hypothetical protein
LPWSETLTLYDETHLVTYTRLLDASDDDEGTDEMVRVVLGIDPDPDSIAGSKRFQAT